MAKRQNFVVGSTNAVTETLTDAQLNNAWDKFEILGAGALNGTFNAVSDYSNDSSNEIANAIQSITGAQPTGNSQSELANALGQMRNEIETSSLTFKGYVSTSAPSSSTYTLVEGNLWINDSAMPTTFPVVTADIKRWDGTAWVAYGSTYTPTDFDFWRNINDNEGYYWFGGIWTVMSTDMSTTYFALNQNTGKWEIKQSINLPGTPTTTTPSNPNDNSTDIPTTEWVHNNTNTMRTNCITYIPQDIQLELNNGTLTLKAGSKVYVPNGVGVFNAVTIASDLTKTATYLNNTQGVVYIKNDNTMDILWIGYTFSGNTIPTSQPYELWYDTVGNLVQYSSDQGSTWTSGHSLPIAVVKGNSSGITSIEQVFNGFGYIGSTVFALPGVKGLIPNGRNTDGTLNNTVTNDYNTVKTVQVNTTTAKIGMYVSGGLGSQTNGFELNEQENFNYDNGVLTEALQVASVVVDSNSRITAFSSKTVFHAVDNNDLTTMLNILYPVGSIYIGTQANCPLATLIPGSTWTVVATKIITDITGIKGAVGTSSASSNGKYFVAQTSSFGQATEPAVGGYNMNVSTDQTIPGASVTNSSITVNVWRRTA